MTRLNFKDGLLYEDAVLPVYNKANYILQQFDQPILIIYKKKLRRKLGGACLVDLNWLTLKNIPKE